MHVYKIFSSTPRKFSPFAHGFEERPSLTPKLPEEEEETMASVFHLVYPWMSPYAKTCMGE